MALGKKDLAKELREIRKEQKILEKRTKELTQEKSLETDMKRWQEIMTVKAALQGVVLNSGLPKRMTLQKIADYPDFYIYQHPTKKSLRSSNRNDEWVRKYCGDIPMGAAGGSQGTEADLIETARTSTMRTWKRLNKKQNPEGIKTTKETILSTKTGKVRATSKVGVG